MRITERINTLSPERRAHILGKLALHLADNHDRTRLDMLLSDPEFLHLRVEALGSDTVLADYRRAASIGCAPLLQTIGDAVRQSAHVIDADAPQLFEQVLARLTHTSEPGIRTFVRRAIQAADANGNPWLRPLTPSLIAPAYLQRSIITRHADAIWDVVVTPDGSHIVTVSADGTLKVFRRDSGEEELTLRGHDGEVLAVAALPDNRRVVSGGSDGMVRVWDIEAGLPLAELTGHTSPVNDVAVSRDGLWLASASGRDQPSADDTVRIWDLTTGRAIRTLRGHTDCVFAVALTSDGQRVISVSEDGTLKVWNIASGDLLCTSDDACRRIEAVSLAPDDAVAISTTADYSLAVWDVSTARRTAQLFAEGMFVFETVKVFNQNRRVVAADGQGSVVIWDLDSGACLQVLTSANVGITALALTADDRWLITADDDRIVRVLDLDVDTDGAIRASDHASDEPVLMHTSQVNAVAFAQQGQCVVSASGAPFDAFSGEHSVMLWRTGDGRALHHHELHGDRVNCIAVSPDGRLIATGSNDRTVAVWDLTRQAVIGTLRHPDMWNQTHVVFADARKVVMAGGNVSTTHTPIFVWDVDEDTVQLRHILPGHMEHVVGLLSLDDGRRVLSAAQDGVLSVWDIRDGRHLLRLSPSSAAMPTGKASAILSVAISLDMRYAVCGYADGTVRVWDIAIAAGEDVMTYACILAKADLPVTSDFQSGTGIRAVALMPTTSATSMTPDVVAVSGQGVLWHGTVDGAPPHPLRRGLALPRDYFSDARATVLPLGPSSPHHVVCAADGPTVEVWDVRAGRTISRFTGESDILCCAVHPDGRTLAVGELSGRVHILRIEGLADIPADEIVG